MEKRKGAELPGRWYGQVSWDDWLAMADIWRMARTKRTECLWSQSLTGCVHYRWPRDWFVSLSKTRTHRRRSPPPSLLARPFSLTPPPSPQCRSSGVTWSSPLVSKVYFSAATRPNGSRWRSWTSIGADSPDWQCRSALPLISISTIR